MTTTPITVSLPFAPELVAKIQKTTTRAPASLETSDMEGKSTRRVYFTALYHQYLTMGQHLNKENDVKFCPQFHHDKVETDATIIPKVSLYHSGEINGSEKKYFPEMVFNRDFSLADYHAELKVEIGTLCEEGISDNYFKFDNLVTHYAHNRSFHSHPDAMKSVLKIPVFANYYLLKMLQAPHEMSFVHPEEKKIITMTQTQWFETYVNEAQIIRRNFIKNRMVQR